MLKAPTRPPYTPGATLVARAPFAFDGRRFYPGDKFDLGDERRRRQLWDARKVEVSTDPAEKGAKSAAAKKMDHEPASKGPSTKRNSNGASTPTAKSEPHQNENQGPVYTAVSKGFGRFDVIDQTTGEVIEGGLAKAAAKSKAEALNETRRGAGEPGDAEGVVCPPAATSGSDPHTGEN